MKKFISLFMAFVMLLSVTAGLNLTAYAENPIFGECGKNVNWKYDVATKTLTISGLGAMNDFLYDCGEWYDSKTPWDGYRENILKVKIERGVTTIGSAAFSYCNSLTSVTIPNSVTIIGECAFQLCSSLTSVTIPNSVTTIKWNAFERCSRLTSVTIGNSVITIGISAFDGCNSLTSVTIPNSVKTIESSAFDCSSLTSINVASGNLNYSSKDGVLFDKNKSELIKYPKGNKRIEYTIPNSVKIIGPGAFRGCSSLTSVTIPNSVTTIENCAFSGCSSLTSVTIPDSVTTIGVSTFEDCTGLMNVNI